MLGGEVVGGVVEDDQEKAGAVVEVELDVVLLAIVCGRPTTIDLEGSPESPEQAANPAVPRTASAAAKPTRRLVDLAGRCRYLILVPVTMTPWGEECP